MVRGGKRVRVWKIIRNEVYLVQKMEIVIPVLFHTIFPMVMVLNNINNKQLSICTSQNKF